MLKSVEVLYALLPNKKSRQTRRWQKMEDARFLVAVELTKKKEIN